MRTKKNKAAYKAVFYVVLTVLFVYYFLKNKDQLLGLLDISPVYLIPIIALQVLTILINGAITKQILVSFNKFIGVVEAFYVSLISSAGNYFGPFMGGAGVRAVYLKNKYKLKYSHFLSTLAGNHIIVILINALFGLVALFVAGVNFSNRNSQVILLILVSMLLLSLVVVVWGVPNRIIERLKSAKTLQKLSTGVVQASEGWNRIINDKSLLVKLTILVSFNFILSVALIYVELLSLQIEISLSAVVIYNVLGTISLLISITPGSLGIREGVLIFSASIIGLSVNEIVAIAVIDRGSRFLVLGFGWLISFYVRRTKAGQSASRLDNT